MQNILVTGANRGIGLEFVKQYVRAGHRVAATCRTPSQAPELHSLTEQSENQLLVFPLDVTNPSQIDEVAQSLRKDWGHLDLLINNAGIFPPNDFNTVTAEAMEKSFWVNAIGPLLLSRAVAGLLEGGQKPMIVNISSLLGSVSQGAGMGRWKDYAYGPSKAALNRLTRQLALDLKPKGITVVAQYPGWVRTEMGGSDAPLSVEQAVTSLRKLFSSFTLKDTGRIIDSQGTDGAI